MTTFPRVVTAIASSLTFAVLCGAPQHRLSGQELHRSRRQQRARISRQTLHHRGRLSGQSQPGQRVRDVDCFQHHRLTNIWVHVDRSRPHLVHARRDQRQQCDALHRTPCGRLRF